MVNERVERAAGVLLGQLAGDALGSLVEFQSKRDECGPGLVCCH